MMNAGQDSINNKGVVLIIGATGNVGREIALAMASKGFDLVLHAGHDKKKLYALCEEAVKAGAASVSPLLLEIADPVDFVESKLLPLACDYLIVAYGPWVRSRLASTSVNDWIRMSMHNLALPGIMLSHYAPGMAERGFGRIIFFGSSASDRIQSYRTIAAYAAAKTALGVLAKSAAREFGALGVTCNVICPGIHEAVNTDSEGFEGASFSDFRVQSLKTLVDLVNFCCETSHIGLNGAILSCGQGL